MPVQAVLTVSSAGLRVLSASSGLLSASSISLNPLCAVYFNLEYQIELTKQFLRSAKSKINKQSNLPDRTFSGVNNVLKTLKFI